MKVNFDTEAIDYLVNDMTQVFKERQIVIDDNQVIIIFIFQDKIMQNFDISKILINSFHDIVNEKTGSFNSCFKDDKKKVVSEIDYIDVLINSMNTEVDNLIGQLDKIDDAIDKAKINANVVN